MMPAIAMLNRIDYPVHHTHLMTRCVYFRVRNDGVIRAEKALK